MASRIFHLLGNRVVGLLLLAVIATWGGFAQGVAVTHSNAHPEIQMWSYPAASSNGAGSVRDRAPTFGSFSGIDPDTSEPVFFPGTGLDPARRGSFLIASDTSSDVPVGLSPDRYQIDSLRVTATVLGNLIFPPSFVLEYDNSLDDPVALTTGGGDDPGQPIEMYGIGLQGDYQTISFDAQSDENALQLGDVRWRPYQEGEPGYDPELPPEEQELAPYQFFALDVAGKDTENSVFGGYSATEVSNQTAQFTPEPFAIGKLYDEQGVEVAPGTHLDYGDLFVFEPNLSDSRIVDYVQQSLAEGHLGFSFSSLHQPAGHTGSVPYPDFYLDDLDVGNNPDGDAPTIELAVTILDPPSPPGDYDSSGFVDHLDFERWKIEFGTAGPSADGNEDGVVDARDYAIWRDNVGAGSVATAQLGSHAVPEPTSLCLIAILGVAVVLCKRHAQLQRPDRSVGGLLAC